MKTGKEIMEELARWKEEDKEGRGFLIIMTDEKTENVCYKCEPARDISTGSHQPSNGSAARSVQGNSRQDSG